MKICLFCVFRLETFNWIYISDNDHVSWQRESHIGFNISARKMESVASFFIHDDDDGPSIAHIAVNCSTRGFTVKVCKPLISVIDINPSLSLLFKILTST